MPARRAGLPAPAMLGAMLLISGCHQPASVAADVEVTSALVPTAPTVGPATLTVTLRRPSGEALAGAAVVLQAVEVDRNITKPG